MNRLSMILILSVSQLVPALYLVICLAFTESKSFSFINLTLIEITALLPSILFILFKVLKGTPNAELITDYHIYLILCYLKGLSVALLLSFIGALLVGLTGLLPFKLTSFLVIPAVSSPIITTYIATKQSNFIN